MSTLFRPSVRLQRTTFSLEETIELGYKIGFGLPGGCVIALSGPLGSGKTALVQGLARGLDVPPRCYVTSPTYTLVNQYPGRLILYHLDIYRLDCLGELEDLGIDEMLHNEAVLAVEWAERLPPGWLETHIRIRISGGGGQRDFAIASVTQEYLRGIMNK